MEMTNTRPVVSTKQMIPSIRHMGYHTTYAIAELIDNSIQAKAKHIEVLCKDKHNKDTGTQQLHEIAILDDGNGMSKNELWDSIRLGESQNRGKGGIGRFGVGLTHSSFSQCLKVEVYSWQKANEVFHIHLDLNALDGSDAVEVEEPIKSKIPDSWKKISKHMSESGTLVIWSNLDKCRWKKAKSLITNSKFMIGRTYRKFLDHGKLKIRMISFDGETNNIEIDDEILPNDPLYLIVPSSTPEPWDNDAMFQKDGEKWEEKILIEGVDGKKHEVVTRYTYVNLVARSVPGNAGTKPYGKHAANNLGVSIVRANRELCLDTNMIISYDPVERWWGAEIEFPPELDEIFGVSSTKQVASELAHVMQIVGKQNREQQGKTDLDGEDENPLFDLVTRMSERITILRNNVGKQRPPSKSTKPTSGTGIKDPPPTPGVKTVTGEQRDKQTVEERRTALNKFIKTFGIDAPEEWPLDQELRFEHAPLTGFQFFDVGLVGGIKVITININHKAYQHLLGIWISEEDIDGKQANILLKTATRGFKKFLASWANMENKTLNPKERKELQNTRYHWGEMLEKYFEVNEE